MKIPKTISKNNREYIFEKQINNNVFLYKEKICGYKECFTKFDLGLVKEIIKPGIKLNKTKIKV